jgi:hypothetical protein
LIAAQHSITKFNSIENSKPIIAIQQTEEAVAKTLSAKHQRQGGNSVVTFVAPKTLAAAVLGGWDAGGKGDG